MTQTNEFRLIVPPPPFKRKQKQSERDTSHPSLIFGFQKFSIFLQISKFVIYVVQLS
jgi:hypothetical protein